MKRRSEGSIGREAVEQKSRENPRLEDFEKKEKRRKAKDKRIIYVVVLLLVSAFTIIGVIAYLSLTGNANSQGAGGIVCAAIVLGAGTILFELIVKWKPIRSYERMREDEDEEGKEEKKAEEAERKEADEEKEKEIETEGAEEKEKK